MDQTTNKPRIERRDRSANEILAERAKGNLRLQMLLERPSDAEKVLRIISILGAATPEQVEHKLRAINLPMPLVRVRSRLNALYRRGYIDRQEDGRWVVANRKVR
jgi:hypothetical protein